MERLELLLGRLRAIQPPDQELKQAVIQALASQLNLKLEPAQISVGKRRIWLRVPPAIRARIFLERERLSEAIDKLLFN